MDDRRGINRIEYRVKSVIVTCDTYDKYFVMAKDVSPLGMGITGPADMPNITGKDVIVVADTLIMYADITRQIPNPDGTWQIGVQARKFTPEVMEYLFTHIAEGD